MATNAPAQGHAPPEPQKQAGPPHPLENMQAMMNLVLITSGRYMKTAKHAPAESPKMQFQLKRAVFAGSERFHDSLDELENEIRHAQAVLRRDLAQMRAQRKEKEAAAKQKEAEQARLATESKSIPPPPSEEVAPPASPTPVKAEPAEPIKVEPEPDKEPTPKAPTPPADPDVSMENTDSLGGMQESEFDFDAVFGDSAMDTSGDAGNEHGDLNLDAGADLDFTLDEQPSDGLLRGLEDFAKGGTDDIVAQNNASALDLDDFNMTDMPDLNESAPPQEPITASATTETTKQDTAGQETTTNSELNLDTMTVDNLDDLFNLDDYENPEATQFDDAFIGFDD
ncbi:hypothetical protein DPSP01_006500 [Paraphaeosphaeria sporulosa]|uniref:Uncharacterized protein n=1 Tax=Paraphaeosphaeria sporulosa TaxID=1460663 RepID=A0A177CMX3_9PLEO|nr:uncharacterized protein CC84DRAFT_1185422 [Paraphaeosphaeria sporulosa]OAG08611.1 hypothetical protein CC84DRAFT_1185422 [Paraphaeosphaeria sporulosa]